MKEKHKTNQVRPSQLLEQQLNTINEMYKDELIIDSINPVCTDYIFTFRNHVPTSDSRSPMAQKYFNDFYQYMALLKNRSYHFLLKDYSICRFHYEFNNEYKLNSYNLLWFPCPFSSKFLGEAKEMCENELEFMDYMDSIQLGDQFNFEDFLLRTPIRVDYDITYEGSRELFHPTAHIHFQHYHTRAKSNSIFCLYNFMVFIIENCYPEDNYLFHESENLINSRMRRDFNYWLKEKDLLNKELGLNIYTKLGL
ncbi:DUF2290 domain-containing protein [Paenibacillus campi]|uniref:DUF2290 domain-containing protein n=1 Tax=Paenibacillus campi TaxID=3106031 RepID=UPI002AFDD48A|nr:DUF2290 domain-containing protein [Paenibacillus sp. SGZ-1014]